jgi:uncharacterized protein (DUF488 family)
MSERDLCVLTIGHSTHSLEALLALLKKHNVTALADVRSMPFSRFNPQFNKDTFESTLREQGIKYVFLGLELGARSDDHSCYENGRIQYARLARTELFVRGIDRVMRGAREHRIALMCAEKEPLECHRTLLVARALDKQGINISHILGDGLLESHRNTMERLLDIAGLRLGLFSSRQELIAQALARQEEKIAYVDDKLAAEASGKSR